MNECDPLVKDNLNELFLLAVSGRGLMTSLTKQEVVPEHVSESATRDFQSERLRDGECCYSLSPLYSMNTIGDSGL